MESVLHSQIIHQNQKAKLGDTSSQPMFLTKSLKICVTLCYTSTKVTKMSSKAEAFEQIQSQVGETDI